MLGTISRGSKFLPKTFLAVSQTMHTCNDDEIFVFGSNVAGLHGRGAALTARRMYGARYGVGEGLTGRAYAIPTKDRRLRPLGLGAIRRHVETFIRFAIDNPSRKFFLTRIGCGLAGYDDADIAPMFKTAPGNVRRPDGW